MNGRLRKTGAGLVIAFMALANQGLMATLPAFAAAKVAKIEVSASATAKVGEALDLTVKAVDASGQPVKDYVGTILISVDSDPKATVPFEEEGYTYVASDQGAKTFSKGLIFSKEGKMKVSVLDIEDENLEGDFEVTVSNTSAAATTSTGAAVTISSPEDGSTVSGGTVDVVGKAKKNTKVKIFVNATESGNATTDEDGNFLFNVKKLDQESNSIVVKQMDAANKVAAESAPITIQAASAEGPAFSSIKVVEGTEIYPSIALHVEVKADPKLSDVTVKLGEDSQVLTEGVAGTYTGTINAPSATGSFQMGLSLKTTEGATTDKDDALEIIVKDAQDIFKNVQVTPGDKKVSFTFGVDPDNAKIAKFKFKYGVAATDLTAESTTFEKTKIFKDGKYTWYIGNLEVGKYFFQIYALDSAGVEIPGVRSAIIDADLSVASAGQCTIPNITGLKGEKKGDVVVLSWDNVPEAVSYNVYKKGTDGTLNLIENVKTNSYTLNFSQDKVKFDEFAIKGVCGAGADEKESLDFSNITRVQTGPGEILILFAISCLAGYFVIRRRRMAQ